MSKQLVSFRFSDDSISELDYLASVYTNGNRTLLISKLIRQMYFLEPLALKGKYRTPGFGVSGPARDQFITAWNIWMCNINNDFVYTRK